MNDNTIVGIGKTGMNLLARMSYEKVSLVDTATIRKFLPDYKYIPQLLYSLRQKGFLKPVKRGLFLYTPLESIKTGIKINEFLIPSIYLKSDEYYIGYGSALNFYSLTEQIFQELYVLNTKISAKRIVDGNMVNFIKVKSEKLYGLADIDISGTVIKISDFERTLVDLIYNPAPIGSISAAIEVFKSNLKRADIKKLIMYLAMFPEIKTRKIAGMILEDSGVSEKMLRPVANSVIDSALISFRATRSGKINNKWKVIE